MNKSNSLITNARSVNIIILLVGAILILVGFFLTTDWKIVLISIGCSLMATAIAVFLSSSYLIKLRRIEELINEWGLVAMFTTRAEMNLDSDEEFSDLSDCIDIVAFGLESFRNSPKIDVFKEKVAAGLKVRILTLKPSSELLIIRDKEESKLEGTTAASIEALKIWVESIRQIAPTANIRIKYYDSLPQGFYWRQDDSLYIGPYLYNKISQQTITYKFRSGSKGFDYYKQYFEALWNDEEYAKEIS